MNTVKSAPCSNCGGVEFTYPSTVGLPAVTVDEQKNIKLDVSNVVVAEIIICNNCDQIKLFKSK